MVHVYNPSTGEIKAGGTQVQGQPGVQRDFVSKNKQNKKRAGVWLTWESTCLASVRLWVQAQYKTNKPQENQSCFPVQY
jgi:hypothetical protein